MSLEPMNNKEELRIKIAYYRKKLGLTQGEVADKMGMSRSSYAYAETKAARLSHNFLVKLATVLKIPESLLIEGQALNEDDAFSNENNGDTNNTLSLSKREERIIKMFRMLSDSSYTKMYDILRKEYEGSMEDTD